MGKLDNDKFTPLFVNCSRGDVSKVKQFLQANKDPELKTCVDATKKSPLHIVANDGYLSIVELLIMNGFNVNARDRTLKTPLHYACLNGHDSVADTLIKSGADVKAKDSLGRSSIHFSVCSSSAILPQLMLSIKPELINDLDNRGRNPMHFAVFNSTQRQIDIVRTLIDN